MFITTNELALVLSDIALELSNTNNISVENINKYLIAINNIPQYSNPDVEEYKTIEILEVVRSYIISHKDDATIKDTATNIIRLISEHTNQFNVPFIANYFTYIDSSMQQFTEKLSAYEKLWDGLPINNTYYEAEYLTSLLRFYLSESSTYISQIKNVSDRLKVLIPLRDNFNSLFMN